MKKKFPIYRVLGLFPRLARRIERALEDDKITAEEVVGMIFGTLGDVAFVVLTWVAKRRPDLDFSDHLPSGEASVRG